MANSCFIQLKKELEARGLGLVRAFEKQVSRSPRSSWGASLIPLIEHNSSNHHVKAWSVTRNAAKISVRGSPDFYRSLVSSSMEWNPTTWKCEAGFFRKNLFHEFQNLPGPLLMKRFDETRTRNSFIKERAKTQFSSVVDKGRSSFSRKAPRVESLSI
ncbi:hypothetical protein HPP92_006961 [Vanilla planifolia]|uniref:Uncharacterized protein n=1 Tax=Vanilla planifolia TaxID=51239 RepID=A0A835RPX1_VANPL|nr:hypothetical protein HPP92_007195 [Vanilla planifolia]KAG0490098.1 hypothetical protein HPP92_006961 [Vanilla planifolia]